MYKAEAARGERDARDKNHYNPPLDARLRRAYEYGFMRGQTT